MNQSLTDTDSAEVGRSTWPELLTPGEVARFLDLELHTVLSAVETGEFSAVQLGEELRIPRRSLPPFNPGSW